MKAMNKKKIILPALLLLLLSAVTGCSYKEEPDRTNDATTSYVTPKGDLPSAEERAYVQALVDEYNKSIKSSK